MRGIVILTMVFITACATPEQRVERQLRVYGPYCDRIGFQRDTDAWRNCVVQQVAIDAQRAQAAAANSANIQRATQIQQPVPIRIVP